MDTQIITYTALGLAALSLLTSAWIILRITKLDRIRREFLSSDMDKNLEQVLVDQNRTITKLRSDLSDLNSQLTDLTILNKLNLNKIGFIRFNPFDDAGGNISFVLALLNAHGDGVVISSLHGRDGTRVYSKKIQALESESKLTDEEIQAIKDAK